VLNRFTFADTF